MAYVGLGHYNFDNWTISRPCVIQHAWFFNGMRIQIFPTRS